MASWLAKYILLDQGHNGRHPHDVVTPHTRNFASGIAQPHLTVLAKPYP